MQKIAHVVAEALHPLVLPNFVFGIIALGGFALMGLIMFSFRDVQNRHSHKSGQPEHHDHH